MTSLGWTGEKGIATGGKVKGPEGQKSEGRSYKRKMLSGICMKREESMGTWVMYKTATNGSEM